MPGTLLMEQAQLTPDTIIHRLRRQLDSDCEIGLLAPCAEEIVSQVAERAVQALWDASRIKVYVPILALRDARDELRRQTA